MKDSHGMVIPFLLFQEGVWQCNVCLAFRNRFPFPKYRYSTTTGESKETRVCPKKLMDFFNDPEPSILL
jgi:hypothetical protein